jgi:hypothetical protein
MRSQWWDIIVSTVKWVDIRTPGRAIAKLAGETPRGNPNIEALPDAAFGPSHRDRL